MKIVLYIKKKYNFIYRITADEIRKQHPRILANKLDTYALEAERYKLDIGKVEKERDHFKSRITELKAVIKEKQKIINDDQGKVDLEKKNLKVCTFYYCEVFFIFSEIKMF